MGGSLAAGLLTRSLSTTTANPTTLWLVTLSKNQLPRDDDFQVNSGAIMSASLLLYMVKPELTVSEKFEYVHHFFSRWPLFELSVSPLKRGT